MLISNIITRDLGGQLGAKLDQKKVIDFMSNLNVVDRVKSEKTQKIGANQKHIYTADFQLGNKDSKTLMSFKGKSDSPQLMVSLEENGNKYLLSELMYNNHQRKLEDYEMTISNSDFEVSSELGRLKDIYSKQLEPQNVAQLVFFATTTLSMIYNSPSLRRLIDQIYDCRERECITLESVPLVLKDQEEDGVKLITEMHQLFDEHDQGKKEEAKLVETILPMINIFLKLKQPEQLDAMVNTVFTVLHDGVLGIKNKTERQMMIRTTGWRLLIPKKSWTA